MKITVLRENLLHTLQVAVKVVNARSPLPVLANVLLEAQKGQLLATASDLQSTISLTCGAKVEASGSITVPAKLLLEFVNQVRSEKISFTLDKGILRVVTDTATAKFNTMPASEFPDMPDLKKGIELKVPVKEILTALQMVQFVAAIDEGRPVLTGIYFKMTSNELILAGTDGFRMAEYRIPIKTPKEIAGKSFVVPARVLGDLTKSLVAGIKDLSIKIDNKSNILLIEGEDAKAYLRMIEGEYPDYEAVVPKEFTTEVKISAGALTNAVKLANIFARDMGNMVKFVIDEEHVEVLSQPTELGSNASKIGGDLDGEEIEIAFNAKYLLEFLNNVDSGKELVFKATESTKPGLFNVEEYQNYFYLVMPMKANW